MGKKEIVGKQNLVVIAQWITSGTLWSVWLMQIANIGYIYQEVCLLVNLLAAGVVVIGLGLLLYYKRR